MSFEVAAARSAITPLPSSSAYPSAAALDPLRRNIPGTSVDGIPLLGSYAVDDDGVPAAAVTLVEDGLLKAFYMSRIPTKEIPLFGFGRVGPGGNGSLTPPAAPADGGR